MNPQPSPGQWFCVRSTVGYEARAAEILARTSPTELLSTGPIRVFCPQIRKMRSVGGKRRSVTGSLFPGYFFAQFQLDLAGRYVASRPGVIGLVRFGDTPTPIPSGVIEELLATDFEDVDGCYCDEFNPGEVVSIQEGPFAGMEAQFVANMNDGQRALLLLEYLNRQVTLVASYSILRSSAA